MNFLVLGIVNEVLTVADLGGAPPTDQNFFNFLGFFKEILLKYWVGVPPRGDWHLLLGEVLDPPLVNEIEF